MSRRLWLVLALAVLVSSAPLSASAILMNQWYTFFWDGHPTASSPAAAYPGSITPDQYNIITPGQGWNGNGTNGFGDAGTPIHVLGTNAAPWTYSSNSYSYVKITDAQVPGAQFQVYDGANLVGTTPLRTYNVNMIKDCVGGDDPRTCAVDPNFSSGIFTLAPGSHSLSVQVINGDYLAQFNTDFAPYGGMAWFAVSDVPEPATVSLMLAGLAGLAVLSRRNRA